MSLTKLNHILVGGIPTPLKKNMKVTWDDDIPNRWKNKKCSKPQTSEKRVHEFGRTPIDDVKNLTNIPVAQLLVEPVVKHLESAGIITHLWEWKPTHI